MERIDVTGILGGSGAEAADEMRELLGNRVVRCTRGLHGKDLLVARFRPLYSCYKHSHGEFRHVEAREAAEECVGCTRWLSEVDGSGGIGVGLKKRRGKMWQKIEL